MILFANIPVQAANLFAFDDWILIFLVVVLLFGGKKIPELMRGVGRGIREFNDAKNNIKNELQEGMKEGMPKEEKK
jgi:sec-independent protein translocase protein TatA